MRNQSRSFIALLIVGLLLAACGSGKPQITAEQTEFDFGDVKIGELVTKDVSVSNTGSGTLEIESVSTSCGCTTAVFDETKIAAGSSTVLHITFDGGAHGDQTGFYTRQVFIDSNDPTQPEIVIQFTANVIRGTKP